MEQFVEKSLFEVAVAVFIIVNFKPNKHTENHFQQQLAPPVPEQVPEHLFAQPELHCFHHLLQLVG